MEVPNKTHPIKKKKLQNSNNANNHKKIPSNEQSFKVEKYSFSKGLFDYKHVIGRGGFGKVWKV